MISLGLIFVLKPTEQNRTEQNRTEQNRSDSKELPGVNKAPYRIFSDTF